MIGDVLRTDVPTCRPEELVAEVGPRVSEGGWQVCAVVNEERVVLGRLDPENLDEREGTAERAMKEGPSTFRPNVGVGEMAEHLRDRDIPGALVTDPEGRLLGYIRLGDLAHHEDHHGEPA